MSTGQTLRVCGAALSDHCALQLLSAGTHRLEPPSAAGEDVTATGSYAYQQGKSRPNLSEGALSCWWLCQDGLSIANFAFAYAVNSGIIRKGCVLRCDRSAINRKGECGGGVVYQTHRHTVISKLKGQLQYEVRSNS